ncbi:hypothetical protein [Sphingobacterium sp.]|uniref:hypothetical protein n=1 Tax=Sphingobacterium sp. TaxID=341027 RepID=UPI0028AB02BD|nr:hypothetical protein [Sphingobacterium sp.]
MVDDLLDRIVGFISLSDEERNIYDNIYKQIQTEEKYRYSDFLKYLFKILYIFESEQIDNVKTFNFHFEINLSEDVKLLIAEFLWRYYFYCGEVDKIYGSNIPTNFLEDEIEYLEKKLERGIEMPEGASRRKRDELLHFQKYERMRKLIYQKQEKRNSFVVPQTLINLKKRLFNELGNRFRISPISISHNTNPFYVSTTDLSLLSYNVCNAESFDFIKSKLICKREGLNSKLFSVLKRIIMFDCDQQTSVFSGFNKRKLENINKKSKGIFRSLLFVTFGKDDCNYRSNLNRIHQLQLKYDLEIDKTFVFLKEEIDILLKNVSEESKIKESFFSKLHLDEWSSFQKFARQNELHELASIKLMNVYTIVIFGEEFKDYIVREIFYNDQNSSIVSRETSDKLVCLDSRTKADLEKSLISVLTTLKNSINKNASIFNNRNNIVLSYNVFNNISLMKMLRSKFPFIGWYEFTNINGLDGITFIINYQGIGKYPFFFYPNIIENTLDFKKTTLLIPGFFFKNIFFWETYRHTINRLNLNTHTIRKNYFRWDDLKENIDQPTGLEDLDWTEENNYIVRSHRDTFVCIFNDRIKKKETLDGAELIFYKESDSNKLGLIRIHDFFELYENDQNYKIMKLAVIIEKLNIYEHFTNIDKLKEIIHSIRDNLGVFPESKGTTWQYLLVRKAQREGGNFRLYSKLCEYFGEKEFVSFNHFETIWLNPESGIVAPASKQVFRLLCEFLGLDKQYYSIKWLLRTVTRTNSREKTLKMSGLIYSLFQDGCFDDDINIQTCVTRNIDKYKKNDYFEHTNENESKIISELVSLIELIKAEINLTELKAIVRNL